ncbi:MAG: ElyC/SanA/YdcF family protein [Acidimicrobiales bacterium]
MSIGTKFAGVAAVALTLCVGWMVWSIARPSEHLPGQANGVVVFAGGHGERLERAQQLMADGMADTLVLNTGTDQWNAEAFAAQVAVCDDTSLPYDVVCVSADNTKGEAIAFARVAEERAWTSMVAVTDDYHLSRASRWLGRCFDGEVYRAAADNDQGIGVKFRELAALGQMFTLDRACSLEG